MLPYKMYQALSDTIVRLAEDGPCVFIGRCAEHILRRHRYEDLFSVLSTLLLWIRDGSGPSRWIICRSGKRMLISPRRIRREEIITISIQEKNGAQWKIMTCV